jgi:hypothetical protein
MYCFGKEAGHLMGFLLYRNSPCRRNREEEAKQNIMSIFVSCHFSALFQKQLEGKEL